MESSWESPLILFLNVLYFIHYFFHFSQLVRKKEGQRQRVIAFWGYINVLGCLLEQMWYLLKHPDDIWGMWMHNYWGIGWSSGSRYSKGKVLILTAVPWDMILKIHVCHSYPKLETLIATGIGFFRLFLNQYTQKIAWRWGQTWSHLHCLTSSFHLHGTKHDFCG